MPHIACTINDPPHDNRTQLLTRCCTSLKRYQMMIILLKRTRFLYPTTANTDRYAILLQAIYGWFPYLNIAENDEN